MNATPAQININRTNAKHLRAAGLNAEADAYDATADELQDEWNELERRRIAAKHAAVNPDEQPDYGPASYAAIITARNEDAALPATQRRYWHTPEEVANDWLCHLCNIMQPDWAGDCLTCEHTDMLGRTD